MAFEPENTLEESLMKAATQPEHRPQFYHDFVDSNIFLIHVPEDPAEPGALPEDRQMIRLGVLEANGRQYIPAFSSVTRLEEFAQQETAYVGLNTLEFLKMIAGQNIVLNPGSEFGKEFLAEEIAAILDGSIWRPVATYKLDKPAYKPDTATEVMLGEPKTYPTELADALSAYFKAQKGVKAAYLAHYFNPATDQQPHTLVAIEMIGDWEDVTAGLDGVVNGVKVPDPPVDFMKISGTGGSGGLEDYFTKEGRKPFYQKKRFGLF